MNIIGRRKLWFLISLLIIIPGSISLVLWKLKPGIDFAGGQVMEISAAAPQDKVEEIFRESQVRDLTITTTGQNAYLVRYRDPEGQNTSEVNELTKSKLAALGITQISFESVGPSVSRDLTRNALVSGALASLAIVLFMALAFRNTPPPVSPWSFGITAVITLMHDTLVLLGVFSILGHFFGVEIDSLFVTAVLTAIGFSVHDTIVVFDRIRENLKRYQAPFEVVVNDSIVETVARSLSTSLTVIFTLTALLIFGGETIRLFVLALLIGICVGTFSSIFNAAPLLVVWHNYKLRRRAKRASRPVKPVKQSKAKA